MLTAGTDAVSSVHTWLVNRVIGAQAVAASTTATLHTFVSTHTVPSTPVTVIVKAWPGGSRPAPFAVHTYRVPPATASADGTPNTPGCAVACPVTSAGTVSVTVTVVTFAEPV